MITVYNYASTPIKNVVIKNIKFNHNGLVTGGINIHGNTNDAVYSEKLFNRGLWVYNRAGDGSGAIGSIGFVADYSGCTGYLRNVVVNRCFFHDNTAASGTAPYSICILTGISENFLITG